MKIALAIDGEILSNHFGHCEKFLICHIEDTEIIQKLTVNNPCLSPSDIPQFLSEKEVTKVIVGGIGQGAIEMLNKANILSIRVDMQDVDKILEVYLQGRILDLGSKCDGKYRK